MKAIIPVAGAGTRLRPHSYAQPRALIPLAGKTVLSFIIDPLIQAGIFEFIFIVGYLGDKIKEYVSQHYPNIKAIYIQQIDRQGVGHAINMARDIVKDDELLVILGDTICEYNVEELVNSPYSMLGVKKVDDPWEFGVAEISEDYFIEHVVEKPQIPKSNLALVGIYKIIDTAKMVDCMKANFVEALIKNGEYSLTDAIECMIKQGEKFKAFKVENWFDCGKKETLLESNATLLKKQGRQAGSQYNFPNTIIIPPVSIGDDCVIENCVIGPSVTIGSNTQLNYSVVRDSIIGSHSRLNNILLESSVIGNDAIINGETRSLNIGDNTEIDLG